MGKEVKENVKLNSENSIIPVRIDQPFFTLKQAWLLKGAVCAWNTFCRSRYIQPLGGIPEGYVGGRAVFKNSTIIEWLNLMDEDMEDYNRKYKTGAHPINKIKKGRRLKNDE